MNGSDMFLDTNIILYLFSGSKILANLIHNKKVSISFVSELEILGFKGISEIEKRIFYNFLKDCEVININDIIKDITIKIKQNYTIKLPDAIIIATSTYLNVPLLTADKGFLKIKEANIDLFTF